MKIPIRATQNKHRGRQFDMPELNDRHFTLFIELNNFHFKFQYNIALSTFKNNMAKTLFSSFCVFIFILLILAFGWQVLDQTIKFVDKKTTMTSRFVAQIDKAGISFSILERRC